MAGRRRRKIHELERLAAEAQAALQANLDKRNALGERWRALEQELKRGDLSAARALEIERERKELRKKKDWLDMEAQRLGERAQRAAHLLHQAQARLREARRVLAVIECPPAWGLGDHSPAQVRQFQERAKKTIQELTGG